MTLRIGSAACACLCLLAIASTASAFTFQRIGDGENQILTWHWEYQSSTYHTCMNTPAGCGNVFSTNGRIPLQGPSNVWYKAGGMLDWSGSSGSLKVSAMPIGYAWPDGWAFVDTRAAVNARDVPLEFTIQGEPGDVFPVTLWIRPKLSCSWNAYTYPNTETDLWFWMDWTVTVNGQVVARDTVQRDFARSNGQIALGQVFTLPRPGAILVPGVGNGSLVSVSVWAFLRTYGTGTARLDVSSVYGSGPALDIDVRSVDAVAVEEPDLLPTGLALAARPNPSRGRTRISYDLPREAMVRLCVYDVSGHRVTTLRSAFEPAGRHELEWEGTESDGRPLATGIYVVELMAGAERRVRKIALLGER